MADWFIATEGVKVVKDSASLWPQIITAVSSAGAALGGVYLAHYFTRRREERAAAAKQVSERLFIATELVFLLEQFSEGCTRLATDSGEQNPEGEYTPTENLPELIITNISGDWRTLPPRVMYRIHELPVLQNEVRRHVAAFYEHYWEPPNHSRYFRERQFQYARLGLKAVILARRLRKLVSLPGTRLEATEWSAQPVLWRVWRKKRKERTEAEIRRRRKNKGDNS
ncbi:hypothetical protein [Klebsiella grimontii]|uniref:hypothetical protein n=1 Tax=Klebsiella grimontii TaxID=2058152 RepID=UPI00105131CC|nr:hypothetical protein [Klebsiella grimontii]TCZ55705.1 hypothetical protein E0D83_26725 [Klebsiella grimontii]